MSESLKFDMGVTLPGELATALKEFHGGETCTLFEGAGYIWRRHTLEEALGSLSKTEQLQVRSDNDEMTLQNIATLAYKEFGAIEGCGIPFHGEFVVHDVSGAPCLISAVPKLPEKARSVERHLKTEKEWEGYADAFADLHTRLIAYLDDRVARGEALLWDIPKFEQYVYAANTRGEKPKFILVDADLRFKRGTRFYQAFIERALLAIATTKPRLRDRGIASDSPAMEELKKVTEGYRVLQLKVLAMPYSKDEIDFSQAEG